MGLRRRSQRIDHKAIVAQRIKRLSSIELKLKLKTSMKLTQMQDIGGCRSILKDVKSARALVESYRSSDIKHKLLTEDDYISNPKPSGYRGIHLVYSYLSDRKDTYNGLKIELQIRSQLQHAWATAVEVVGTMIDQALKSSLGDEGWLRFFQLMSSEIARTEERRSFLARLKMFAKLVMNSPNSSLGMIQ
ncbi:MAG: RelA/SpoT domain-containing protein [Sphingomonas sp.]